LKKATIIFTCLIVLLLAVPAVAASPPLTLDQAMETAKMHKSGITSGTYPLPVWLKSQYKLQPVRPVRSALCPTIGRTELMWGAGNNPPSPGQADNFAYLLWRWRDCCAW
jgi:hypothetical protein